MSSAQINLIIGSEEPHYTASKIYPILMADRPHLSILQSRSSSHEILSRASGGITLAFETTAELDALIPKIAEELVKLSIQPESVGRVDPPTYADYTAHSVAGCFAVMFRRVCDEYVGERSAQYAS